MELLAPSGPQVFEPVGPDEPSCWAVIRLQVLNISRHVVKENINILSYSKKNIALDSASHFLS